jgi:hypothetical protein
MRFSYVLPFLNDAICARTGQGTERVEKRRELASAAVPTAVPTDTYTYGFISSICVRNGSGLEAFGQLLKTGLAKDQ